MKPHQEISKLHTKQVLTLGFINLKTSWWERKQDFVLKKIHIHKFSFTTDFRAHAAIHLAGFDKDLAWLNGMHSQDGWYEKRSLGLPLSRYEFKFSDSSKSWQNSANNLFKFTKGILTPWFERWSNIKLLQIASDSPLNEEHKAFLAQSGNTSKIS